MNNAYLTIINYTKTSSLAVVRETLTREIYVDVSCTVGNASPVSDTSSEAWFWLNAKS